MALETPSSRRVVVSARAAGAGNRGPVLLRLYRRLGAARWSPTPPASRSRAAIRRSTPRRWPRSPELRFAPALRQRPAGRRAVPPAGALPPPRVRPRTRRHDPSPASHAVRVGARDDRLDAADPAGAGSAPGIRTPVYGKAEYVNPGGSVKDRIGLRSSRRPSGGASCKPGGTIVEGTSGNTGVGLAIAAALKGYRCIFTMPDKMSQEKVRLLKAFGAEVVITPTAVPPDHPDNYVMKAKQIVRGDAGRDPGQPVLQPGQSRGALRDHGSGDLGADRGQGHPLRRGRGDRRHDERRGQVPEGEEPQGPGHRGRPGRLALHRLSTAPSAMGEGHPYKVEGIGGDKIPTTIWFDLIDEFRQVSDRDVVRRWRAGSPARRGSWSAARPGSTCALALEIGARAGRPRRAASSPSCATPASATCPRCSTTSGCRRTRCSRRRGPRCEQLLERRPAKRAAAGERGAGGGGAAGAQPHEHLGREPDPGGRERRVASGGLIEGTLMTRALAQPSLLDRPVREVMEAPFPEVEARLPRRSARRRCSPARARRRWSGRTAS